MVADGCRVFTEAEEESTTIKRSSSARRLSLKKSPTSATVDLTEADGGVVEHKASEDAVVNEAGSSPTNVTAASPAGGDECVATAAAPKKRDPFLGTFVIGKHDDVDVDFDAMLTLAICYAFGVACSTVR